MRPVSLALLVVLVLALAACGGDGPTTQNGPDAGAYAAPASPDGGAPPDSVVDAADSGCVDGVGDGCLEGCALYCDLALASCGELYASLSACEDACATLGPDDDPAGDTLACRMAYLERVAEDPSTAPALCPNAAADESPSCTLPVPDCGTYCALLTDACGDQSEAGDCESICQHLPLGELGGDADHSVACRQRAAAAALASPAAAADHCGAAGISGGEACGTPCETYCTLALALCEPLFADAAACLTACEAIPTLGPDSLSCRIDQLTLSAEPIAARCTNAAPDGGDVCIPPPTCEAYCKAVMGSCSGADQQYFNLDTCVTYCAEGGAFPGGQAGDASGHSVACRATYAAAAAAASGDALSLRCDEAGPSCGGVCGTPCEIYCTTAQQNCTGDDTLHDTPEACQAACLAISAQGVFGAEGEDTVQCRISKLGSAGTATGAARSAACLAAGLSGEGGCQDPEPICATYCGGVMAACGDANRFSGQYANEAACLATCEGAWPAGSYADSDADTLGCRLGQARLAVTDPDLHCDAAGATGGGVCGAWCDLYCGLVDAHCPTLYPSADLCPSLCGGLPTDGWAGATDGDTVQCRLTHLGLVATGEDAAALCPEAHATTSSACTGETSPPPPSPACVAYCDAVSAECPSIYADIDACLDYCWSWARLPAGVEGDVEGHSVACRASAAASGACDLTGPSGGGQCGDWCDNYCHLARQNCAGDHELYESLGDCRAACALFPTHGAEGDEGGDTVQCRIHALGLAGSVPGVTEGAYCPRGSVDGGGACVDSAEEWGSWSGMVQAVLKARCGGCHAGVAATECPGGGCFATHFAATQLPSYACLGETKGGCLLAHLDAGGAYHGGGDLPEPDRATVQAWIAAGQPE